MKSEDSDMPLFKLFLEDRGIAESTISLYLGVLKQFTVRDPDIDDSESYINFLIETSIKKRNYANQYALRYYLRFKFGTGSDNENRRFISDTIQLMKDRKIRMKDSVHYLGKKPLTDDEIAKVINGLQHEKHQVMAYIMCETGLRIGDVLRIRRNDIGWDDYKGRKVLKITTEAKGEKVRTVWIPTESVGLIILDFVQRIDYGTGYSFMWKRSRKTTGLGFKYGLDELKDLNYQRFYSDLKETMDKLQIERNRFAAHSFRRRYAKLLWNKYRNIDLVKTALGHSNISTTMLYLRNEGMDVVDIMVGLHDKENTFSN